MAQIQGIGKFAAAATTIAYTPSATGSGTRALVLWLWFSSSTAPTAISDSSGGSLAGGQWKQRDGNAGAIFLFDYLGCPSGITTVTVTMGSTTYVAFLCERDDISAWSKFRFTEVGTTTSWSSGTVTTSAATEIGMGFAATFSGAAQNYAASGAWANGTGTAVTAGQIQDATNGNTGFIENQTISPSTTLAATGTCTSSYTYAAIGTYTQLSTDTLMGQGAY